MTSSKKAIAAGVLAGMFLFFAPAVFATWVDLDQYVNPIADVSIDPDGMTNGATTEQQLSGVVLFYLHGVKIFLSGLAIIYLIYVGITMVTAMGDEKDLKKAKSQFIYTLTAFLFINIPGQILELFSDKNAGSQNVTDSMGKYSDAQNAGSNIFLNFGNWSLTVQEWVLVFLRVFVYGLAIGSIILAGIGLISSQWAEDKQKKAKNQILHSVIALIFMWFIEATVWFATYGNIAVGQAGFAKMINMALFFAAPIAIFFLAMGWYYYITSYGDEEKAKKGKAIIMNTLIALILLVTVYGFLLDLKTFVV